MLLYIITHLKKSGLIVLFLLYILDIWIPYEGFRSEGFFFYSLGAYLSLNKKGFIESFSKIKSIAIWAAIATLVICLFTFGTEWYWYARRLFCTFGTITVLWIVSILVKNGRIQSPNSYLVEVSFVVFAAHMIGIKDVICAVINMVINHLPPINILIHEISCIFGYILAPILTTAIIVMAYYYLKKLMPNVCMVLTGGRTR